MNTPVTPILAPRSEPAAFDSRQRSMSGERSAEHDFAATFSEAPEKSTEAPAEGAERETPRAADAPPEDDAADAVAQEPVAPKAEEASDTSVEAAPSEAIDVAKDAPLEAEQSAVAAALAAERSTRPAPLRQVVDKTAGGEGRNPEAAPDAAATDQNNLLAESAEPGPLKGDAALSKPAPQRSEPVPTDAESAPPATLSGQAPESDAAAALREADPASARPPSSEGVDADESTRPVVEPKSAPSEPTARDPMPARPPASSAEQQPIEASAPLDQQPVDPSDLAEPAAPASPPSASASANSQSSAPAPQAQSAAEPKTSDAASETDLGEGDLTERGGDRAGEEAADFTGRDGGDADQGASQKAETPSAEARGAQNAAWGYSFASTLGGDELETALAAELDLTLPNGVMRSSVLTPIALAGASASGALHSAETARVVANQVTAALQQNNGQTRIEIALDPPELGSLKLQLSFDENGRMSVMVHADRDDTLDLMRRHSDELARQLEEAGFTLDDMSFAGGGEQGAGFMAEQDAPPSHEGFIDASEIIAPPPPARGAMLDGRLDLRV